MDKLSQTLLALCCASIVIFVIWVIPVSDSEICYPLAAKRVNEVLMCKCSDNEWQKVGKCRD